jgi:FtsZ-interacting cell division protein YlmF
MSILKLLERLGEMFPKQDYHSRMDRYITAKQPKSTADVENLQKQFEQQNHKGLIL